MSLLITDSQSKLRTASEGLEWGPEPVLFYSLGETDVGGSEIKLWELVFIHSKPLPDVLG